jgi:hypothetical protein
MHILKEISRTAGITFIFALFRDFLGSVTLILEDMRRVSNSDASQRCQLQGVKSGVVEINCTVYQGVRDER